MSNELLFITIGKRSRLGSFPVTARSAEGPSQRGTLVFEPPPSRAALPSWEIGGQLAGALFRGRILDRWQAVSVPAYGQIRLRILADELYGLPWERMLDHPPLAGAVGLGLTRYSPRLSELALVPLSLPIDLLIAGLSQRLSRPFLALLPGAEPARYFAATISNRMTESDLKGLLSLRSHDVVLLQGDAYWDPDRTGRIGASSTEAGLGEAELRALLKKGRTRLLILQGDPPGPLLDLGHRVLGRSGPSVMVVSAEYNPPEILQGLFQQFFFDVVHDRPLDEAAASARSMAYVALLHAREGENLLLISEHATRLRAQEELELHTARQVRSRLEERARMEGAPPEAAAERLGEAIARLEEARNVTLSFEHETGGMVPLTEASAALDETRRALEEARPYAERVVNTWFSSEGRALTPDESLGRGRTYRFHLQIGARSAKSNVVAPRGLPERELERFYSKEGLELRVVLFSADFELENPDRSLRLPRPPEESEEIDFVVVAPARGEMARLRACVYFRHTLLQSLLVTATLTAAPRRGERRGNRTEVDFALTESWGDLERFGEPAVNILTNESPDGSHTFSVAGASLRRELHLTEGAMRHGIDEAREKLQAVCSTLRNGKPDRYRFEPDNRGKETAFVSDMKTLAQLGFELYTGLVTQQDWEFQDRLRGLLRAPGRTIQVAQARHVGYVFPWALVYDRPLAAGDGNVLCSRFLEDLQRGGGPDLLQEQMCLGGGCPHEGELNVVCPSGFWGFKHVIEQPLTTRPARPASREEPVPTSDRVVQIEVSGKVALVMAVSENLKEVSSHRAEVEALAEASTEIQSALEKIGRALQRADVHVVYFYCHGGRSGRKVWLGVGNKEKLFNTDLVAWGVRWPIQPLVFINGCHTVDLTPDDLLSFNQTLAFCGASGVLGTEIIIPETLARHFAEGFLADFLSGRTVGDSVRRQRLRLLEGYNPLGLAYTPYCLAQFRLVRKQD